MILYIKNHTFQYEIENLCRVFFPLEDIRRDKEPENGESTVTTEMTEEASAAALRVNAVIGGKSREYTARVERSVDEYQQECELQMARLLFRALTELTGYTPEWGVLTGVRPSKLMNRLIQEKGSCENAQKYFRERFFVTPQKAELAAQVALAEQSVIELSRPESFSLYVSIPFCPTRCSYCSFVSHSMGTAKKLLPEYVRLLANELKLTGEYARALGLRLESVYFGGGTPTTLSAQELLFIAEAIRENFDLSNLREYTVEAGRPDTITAEKLEAMRQIGVTRISINPQTLNDEVLQHIGRRHTAQQTLDAFALARSHGFDNINMDLIAGLPLDTLESFSSTLSTVTALAPESVTVHTLALKRSSSIVTHGEAGTLETTAELTGAMLGETTDVLTKNKYYPYYMYRQSRCVGNLENVGWCLPGRESLYNIFMMEEVHTVLAAGAGAVTKLKTPDGAYIERVFNYKYPYEYIGRFDELMERKKKITEFYKKYC